MNIDTKTQNLLNESISSAILFEHRKNYVYVLFENAENLDVILWEATEHILDKYTEEEFQQLTEEELISELFGLFGSGSLRKRLEGGDENLVGQVGDLTAGRAMAQRGTVGGQRAAGAFETSAREKLRSEGGLKGLLTRNIKGVEDWRLARRQKMLDQLASERRPEGGEPSLAKDIARAAGVSAIKTKAVELAQRFPDKKITRLVSAPSPQRTPDEVKNDKEDVRRRDARVRSAGINLPNQNRNKIVAVGGEIVTNNVSGAVKKEVEGKKKIEKQVDKILPQTPRSRSPRPQPGSGQGVKFTGNGLESAEFQAKAHGLLGIGGEQAETTTRPKRKVTGPGGRTGPGRRGRTRGGS